MIFDLVGVFMLAAMMADVTSSELAIARGLGVEGNPLMSSRTARLTVKPAVTVGIWYATERAHRVKPKTALVFRIALTVLYSYAATRNFQIAYSLRF